MLLLIGKFFTKRELVSVKVGEVFGDSIGRVRFKVVDINHNLLRLKKYGIFYYDLNFLYNFLIKISV